MLLQSFIMQESHPPTKHCDLKSVIGVSELPSPLLRRADQAQEEMDLKKSALVNSSKLPSLEKQTELLVSQYDAFR